MGDEVIDPALLFGEIVGVDVAPGADLGEVTERLSREAASRAMERIDRLQSLGLWTGELQRLYEALDARRR